MGFEPEELVPLRVKELPVAGMDSALGFELLMVSESATLNPESAGRPLTPSCPEEIMLEAAVIAVFSSQIFCFAFAIKSSEMNAGKA